MGNQTDLFERAIARSSDFLEHADELGTKSSIFERYVDSTSARFTRV